MSDSEDDSPRSSTSKILRFHGRRGEDNELWRLRLRASCRVKGLWDLVNKPQSEWNNCKARTDEQSGTAKDLTSSTTNATKTKPQNVNGNERKLIARMEKTSRLIISALGNAPLRVVPEDDGDPSRMLQLLHVRYDSNRTVSRIAIQTQLYSMNYKNQDISKYIDEFTTLFSQLDFVGKKIGILEPHKAPMLLASIDPSSTMEPIAAALRTEDADDLIWDYVATTLIDEYNAKKKC